MLAPKYMTRNWAYLIGRNLADWHWPEDGKYSDVLCEIVVRPGKTVGPVAVIKATFSALYMALCRLWFAPRYVKRMEARRAKAEACEGPWTGPWCCPCGYEGVWEADNGVCPVCHGYGTSKING